MRRFGRNSWTQLVAWIAIAVAAVGVFSTWTVSGPVTLNGTQAPNNGWLVLIMAAFALGWTRPMRRGSWIGVVGVGGAALVMGWTAIVAWHDTREIAGTAKGHGLVLVLLASVALGAAAVGRGVELARTRSEG